MADPTSIPQRITDRIKASGVTLVWLCKQTGIPRSTMDRRLAHPADFTLNEIDRIAVALRMAPEELLVEVAA